MATPLYFKHQHFLVSPPPNLNARPRRETLRKDVMMEFLLHAGLISAKGHKIWWWGHQKVMVFPEVRIRHGAAPIILSTTEACYEVSYRLTSHL